MQKVKEFYLVYDGKEKINLIVLLYNKIIFLVNYWRLLETSDLSKDLSNIVANNNSNATQTPVGEPWAESKGNSFLNFIGDVSFKHVSNPFNLSQLFSIIASFFFLVQPIIFSNAIA
jgi:hypothetical protein